MKDLKIQTVAVSLLTTLVFVSACVIGTKATQEPTTAIKSGHVEKAPAKTNAKDSAKAAPKSSNQFRVLASTLLIREQPNAASKVVGRLGKGSVVPASVVGSWAKLATGHFVNIKYLQPIAAEQKPQGLTAAAK
jgi:hypothetical protein